MSRRGVNSDNLDLIGLTFHAPGSIGMTAVEDVHAEQRDVLHVIGLLGGIRRSASAADVRRWIENRSKPRGTP